MALKSPQCSRPKLHKLTSLASTACHKPSHSTLQRLFADTLSPQLMLSTYHGHLPLSRILLSHGADPNRLNDRGQSPLAGAVFKGEGEIVDLLLEAGADVDLGKPSAAEAILLFKKTDEYGAKFEEARERLKRNRDGGIGGAKGAFEMM